MIGRINSIVSLGTVDGPGIRYVVFLQGCNLRCSCCHNPETWDKSNGYDIEDCDLFNKILNYKAYFGKKGGITVSGGEPLLQSQFVTNLFKMAQNEGINTCLDTSGSIFNDSIKELLKYTNTVLLDIKYQTNDKYQKYVGTSYDKVIEFLDYLKTQNINTILRKVIIPTINDDIDEVKKLNELANQYHNVSKVELLPFKKLCVSKYNQLGIDFKFKNIEEASLNKINELNNLLDKV